MSDNSNIPTPPWAAEIPEGSFISYTPTYKVGEYFNRFHKASFENMNYYYFDAVHPDPPLIKLLFHRAVCGLMTRMDVRCVYACYDRIAARYSKKPTGKVGEISILFDDRRYHWRREVFETSTELPFEHTMIRVPAGWEEFLTNTFGDYRKIPENKKERALHTDMVFDPETPYTEHGINSDK